MYLAGIAVVLGTISGSREVAAEPADRSWSEVAAEVLGAIARDRRLSIELRRESAHAALIALRRARATDRSTDPGPWEAERRKAAREDIDERPTPLTADEQAYVDATDRFLTLAAGERSERVAGARLIRGNLRRRHFQDDAAAADFAFILTHERRTEVGLYAAKLLLDLLVRQERYDEMVVWVWRLRTDGVLLARDPELAAHLEHIEARWWEVTARRAGRPLAGKPVLAGVALMPLAACGDLGAVVAARFLRP